MLESRQVGTTYEDLRKAFLELSADFDAHNHDGTSSRSFETLRAESIFARIMAIGTPGSTRGQLSALALAFYNSSNKKVVNLNGNGLEFLKPATGAAAGSLGYTSSSSSMILGDDSGDTDFILNINTYVYRLFKPEINANDVDIGATTTGHRFRTIYLINSPDVSSSREGKEKIRDIKYGLKEVLQMQPVSFSRKTRKRNKNLEIDENETEVEEKNLGFIAEDMHQIVPEVATMESIKPDHLIPILVKAIQELTARVVELESK